MSTLCTGVLYLGCFDWTSLVTTRRRREDSTCVRYTVRHVSGGGERGREREVGWCGPSRSSASSLLSHQTCALGSLCSSRKHLSGHLAAVGVISRGNLCSLFLVHTHTHPHALSLEHSSLLPQQKPSFREYPKVGCTLMYTQLAVSFYPSLSTTGCVDAWIDARRTSTPRRLPLYRRFNRFLHPLAGLTTCT